MESILESFMASMDHQSEIDVNLLCVSDIIHQDSSLSADQHIFTEDYLHDGSSSTGEIESLGSPNDLFDLDLVDIPHLDRCAGCEVTGDVISDDVSSVVDIPLTVQEIASCSGDNGEKATHIKSKKRKKKRKKKTSPKSQVKTPVPVSRKPLWLFLLHSLHDPAYNPSVITWTNQNAGVFRITDCTGLTQMWYQTRSRLLKVKYEFLARSFRHYYSKGILRRVPGKKLVYQFGDKVNWRTKHKT